MKIETNNNNHKNPSKTSFIINSDSNSGSNPILSRFMNMNFISSKNNKSIVKHTCHKVCVFIIDFVSVYLIWIFIHIISANMYVYFCADISLYGIVSSIFITQSPHCRALRYAIDTGVSIINSMWATTGVWITNYIINMNINTNNNILSYEKNEKNINTEHNKNNDKK